MTEAIANNPDAGWFVEVWQRYREHLTPGQRAELRRVAEPDDLRLVPALYTLFPGQRPSSQHRRLAYLLNPACSHQAGAPSLGAQMVKRGIAAPRVIQMARAQSPIDIVQLRRLLTHLSVNLDWREVGTMVWYWGESRKRALVEDYFIAQSQSPSSSSKGAKS